MSTYQQAGKLEYVFQFDSPTDIAKITKAIGMNPTKISIRRQPEFIHETKNDDGEIVWRLFGPEYAEYRMEGYLFCEDKFRSATGFSYKGDDYIIEGRSINRENTDWMMCEVSGKGHVNISIPKELLDTYGILFASEPKAPSISSAEESFDVLPSSPTVQFELADTEGGPVVDAWATLVATGSITAAYGAPLPNGSYKALFSASPVTAPAGTTYRSGSESIGDGAGSVSVTFPNAISSPWVMAYVVLPSVGADQITGFIDQSSVTSNGFTYYLESNTPSAGYVLHWAARELGENLDGYAYGYTDLSSQQDSFTISYSLGEVPAVVHAQLAAETSTDSIVAAAADISTATHRQVTVNFDSAIPSGDTYRLYWQAKLI
jgi:hypothetical protein